MIDRREYRRSTAEELVPPLAPWRELITAVVFTVVGLGLSVFLLIRAIPLSGASILGG